MNPARHPSLRTLEGPSLPPSSSITTSRPRQCLERGGLGLMLGALVGLGAGVTELTTGGVLMSPSASSPGSNLKAKAGVASTTTNNDSFRSKLRDPTLRQILVKQNLTTVAVISAWSAVYQSMRCAVEPVFKDEPKRAAAAVLASVAPMLPLEAFRRRLPWIAVMVGLDIYNGGLGGGRKPATPPVA